MKSNLIRNPKIKPTTWPILLSKTEDNKAMRLQDKIEEYQRRGMNETFARENATADMKEEE